MLFTAAAVAVVAVELTGVCNVSNGSAIGIIIPCCEFVAGLVVGTAVGHGSDDAVRICEFVAGLTGGAAVGNGSDVAAFLCET